MDVYQTEEEQVEALKRWWNENGRAIVTGVVLAIVIVVSWQQWRNFSEKKAVSAAVAYESFQAATMQREGKLTDEQRQTAKHLLAEMKENFGRSQYTRFAALTMASLAIQNQDHQQAISELQWVLDSGADEVTEATTTIRLARVLISAGELASAGELLAIDPPEAFRAQWLEVTGDLRVAEGKDSDAQLLYQQALELSEKEGLQVSPVLQLKAGGLPPKAE